MRKTFIDSAEAPIIAFDFDGTINIDGEDTYPVCGSVRKYAKEVINLLHDVGCRIVIWTSRDVAYNQEEKKLYDHISDMIEFLDGNRIEYDAINKSVQFAPYHYNGRKVYAHLYVDDRAFGWKDSNDIMIGVLRHILSEVIGIGNSHLVEYAVHSVLDGTELKEVCIHDIRRYVKHWKD